MPVTSKKFLLITEKWEEVLMADERVTKA